MKKIFTLSVLFIAFFLLTGCINKDTTQYLVEITFDELYEKIENKETFILEITQDGCSHCSVFNPRFKSVLEEYQIKANFLNFSTITEEQYEQFSDDFGDVGTPTVIFMVEGSEKTLINRLSGEPSKKEIIRKLTQNGYIEE